MLAGKEILAEPLNNEDKAEDSRDERKEGKRQLTNMYISPYKCHEPSPLQKTAHELITRGGSYLLSHR